MEGRQPGGRPSDAHFLSVLLGTAVVDLEQMDHSLAPDGAHLTLCLLSNSFLRNNFLLWKGWLLVLTRINSQKWVGVNKYQPAAMVVWCFCSTSGERERELSAGWGAIYGMREGWMMELTQPCSWLGCSISDLLNSWLLSRWSPFSHAHSFNCNGTPWTPPLIDVSCWRNGKLPQQANSEIPAVFCQGNGLPGPHRS